MPNTVLGLMLVLSLGVLLAILACAIDSGQHRLGDRDAGELGDRRTCQVPGHRRARPGRGGRAVRGGRGPAMVRRENSGRAGRLAA